MNRRPRISHIVMIALSGASLLGMTSGMQCAGTGPGEFPANPEVPAGNRPPRVEITSVSTPSNDNFAEQGETVRVNFTGDDGEETATVRVFASRIQTPTTSSEIPIQNGIEIGPGPESGTATWNTTSVPVGLYFIFAEISDGVNPPVLVTSASAIQVAPPGSRPQNQPPNVTFLTPLANLGLSANDDVSILYIFSDTDSQPRITLLLDKDQNPTNDNINNPGDPFSPSSNIIILPSENRRRTDPTYDGDPPPPDDPNNPPSQADSLDIRRNPRTLGQTAPGIVELKEYRFTIDFSRIPVRNQPYYLRATIEDGVNPPVHRYATGSITITQLANGVVDTGEVGFRLAGARFGGFGTGDLLGSAMTGVPDIDGDGQDEMIFSARYGSPRNRMNPGAAYLIFGRRKLPFPLDTNGNGIPDVIDGSGNTVDFPPPPAYVPNPYLAVNIGRFGGVLSINSVGSFFRGTTYAMPAPHNNHLPPAMAQTPQHPGLATSGLTSLTRLDMTGDNVPDLVFGVPFVSGALDFHDDDPVDGGCDIPYGDGLPNQNRCENGVQNDDITGRNGELIDEGIVMMVDGTNDIANAFRLHTDAAMAGQNDPNGPIDDDGLLLPPGLVPVGMRFRGGWFDNIPPISSDNLYGWSVSTIGDIDADGKPELVVTIPGSDAQRGRVHVWYTRAINYLVSGHGQDVLSLPSYIQFPCIGGPPSICNRGFVVEPRNAFITGAQAGDFFGYGATNAGTFNQDGPSDLMVGAPRANRQVPGTPVGTPALNDNGDLYIFFTPAGGFGNFSLVNTNPPRVEIIGTHDGDRFGEVQASVADMNGDSIDDVAFASQFFDDDSVGNADAGYVGVIFGNRPLTGERGFTPNDVATPALSGIRFFGATSGARAGASISSAGDFNRDGYGDLLIACPGERRDMNVGDTDGDGIDNVETRLGVAYLIFGGTHLINKTFNLSQVGNPELPGIIFVSRYVLGSENEAELEVVAGLGDIDGDGFDDVAVAAPKADFIDTASPNQRRIDAGEVYIIYGNNFGSNKLGG